MEDSNARHDVYYEDGDGCGSDDPHAEEDDDADEEDDGGDEQRDDEESDDDDEEGAASDNEEIEREWAAMEIQHAWRAHNHHHLHHHHKQLQTEELASDHSAPQTESKRKSESVCCNCFGLIDEPATASGFDNREGEDDGDDDQVFCVACLYAMARTTTAGSATPSVASPLPKLSMLVQAEAKYQDQLQLLRAKQEVLRQQQQEMLNRKSAEAKQLAADRALARERRRLFQLNMERKKREEELKYQQLHISSNPEQDDSDALGMASQSTVNSTGKRKKMKEMIPIPLRRTLQLAAASSETSSPLTTLFPGLEKKSHQLQRKTHFLKKMVGCYAQDLTPLVNGHKPKLLPVPSPVAPPAAKKPQHHQQSPSLSRASPCTKAKAQGSSSKKQQQHQLKSKKPGKLHPIEARATRKPSSSISSNNQHDEDESASSSSALFSSYSRLSTQPLTAEIKPVSWIYELGKGVLDDELTGDYQMHQQIDSSHSQPLARFAQLDSVQEESNEPIETRSSFDLRLKHKLPAKTVVLASSSSMALPSAAPTSSISTGQQQQQWEYSTDRLASLLEKYNVSVTTATK